MLAKSSLLDSLISTDAEERERAIRSLTEAEAAALLFDWELWARPEQLPPAGPWSTWLILAGRGFGKTRTGAEALRVAARTTPLLMLIGPTAGDTRDVMVEGPSGIMAISPRGERPKYEPSKRRLTWPNGARATTFSAEEPERLRGPQGTFAWCDEFAAWKFPREAWDNLAFGLRLGRDPRVVVTTTPKNLPVLKEIRDEPETVVTSGSTYANYENLAERFIRSVVRRYEGTRIGRQELHAELLEDVPGALWQRDQLDELRVRTVPKMRRVVLGVDPAVSANEGSDESGLLVVGRGEDGDGYVLEDASAIYTPAEWAAKIGELGAKWSVDCVVAEVNNGGDLVESNMRTDPKAKLLRYKAVHATRGKRVRAEPIAGLYEQKRFHHHGLFAHLEDQMCTFSLDGYEGSPDRVDALVWAATELMLGVDVEIPTVTGWGIEKQSKWR